MTFIQSLAARLPALDARSTSQIEQEILDELNFHLAMRTEENMTHGMSADAAQEATLAQFGDFAAVQNKCRRALLGNRIMSQRIQMGLSALLLAAVVFLAWQLYSGQRANQDAIDSITNTLKQLTPTPAAAVQTASQNSTGPNTTGPSAPAQTTAPAPAQAAIPIDPKKTYPIDFKPEAAREFAKLAVDFGKFKLTGESITLLPITTEAGLTGAILIGDGTYTCTPADGKEFTGHFRAALLRFNPHDAESIIDLDDGKPVTDKGALELARAVLAVAFRHCYHSGPDALIPPDKALAAEVFEKELGDVLFSNDGTTTTVYNFTAKKQLYPEK